MFPNVLETFPLFSSVLKLLSANFQFGRVLILSFEKRLNPPLLGIHDLVPFHWQRRFIQFFWDYIMHVPQKDMTWRKVLILWLTFPEQKPYFYVSEVQFLWEHCGKRKIIFPFPIVFSTLLDNFSSSLRLSSAKSLSLGVSEICRFGKGLY